MSKAAEFREGWRDVAAATVGLGLGIPGYTAISSLFFQAVRTEFGWSSAATAGSLVALPVTAAALPVAGRLIDRFGVRLISGASVLFVALGFFWLSRLHGGIAEYYAAILLLNVLGCATGPIAYTRLVAARFSEARGSALAIAQFGIALIAAAAPPLLATLLIGTGWRGAYRMLTLAALVGGAAAQFLMRGDPTRSGAPEGGPGLGVAEALRTRAFWALGTAILCVSAASLGLVSQFQPMLVTRGVDLRTGAWLLSLLAVAVAVSRLVVGRLLDLARPERCAAATIAVAGLGAALLLAAGSNLSLISLGVLFFGVSIGAELDFLGFFCARLFGCAHYSALYGLLSVGFYLGMAVGGIGYGVVRDATGSYAAALAASTVLFAASATLFTLLGAGRDARPAVAPQGAVNA